MIEQLRNIYTTSTETLKEQLRNIYTTPTETLK